MSDLASLLAFTRTALIVGGRCAGQRFTLESDESNVDTWVSTDGAVALSYTPLQYYAEDSGGRVVALATGFREPPVGSTIASVPPGSTATRWPTGWWMEDGGTWGLFGWCDFFMPRSPAVELISLPATEGGDGECKEPAVGVNSAAENASRSAVGVNSPAVVSGTPDQPKADLLKQGGGLDAMRKIEVVDRLFPADVRRDLALMDYRKAVTRARRAGGDVAVARRRGELGEFTEAVVAACSAERRLKRAVVDLRRSGQQQGGA
jgi:hypothetical protein